MAVFLVISFAVPGCFSCNAYAAPKSRAKVVEEYVISAKFDENSNFPQLNDGSQPREIYREDGRDSRREAPASSSGNRRHDGRPTEGFDHGLEERDFLVHHHHLPPAAPPPPPPPPAALAHAPALFAVGFIAFLILLNSLQTSLLLLKPKGSLLGSVAGALGRKKRFAWERPRELKYGQGGFWVSRNSNDLETGSEIRREAKMGQMPNDTRSMSGNV